MLKLILGRAGSGKTARIMEEIKQGDSRRPGLILLVRSNTATRRAELCRVCGDAMSLYAEVEFYPAGKPVEAEVGGGAKLWIRAAHALHGPVGGCGGFQTAPVRTG